MKVHHLDCFTMCPVGRHRMNADGRLAGHVLAIETPSGSIALVDTGIGLGAVRDPKAWLGRFMMGWFRPQLDEASSAVARLEALGFSASDVSDVLVTHLDADHAGGLADFPAATVHVHHLELAAVMTPGMDVNARVRRRPALWAHGPKWASYGEGSGGDAWFGFEAVRALPGLGDRIVAVPLPGHTRGHTAIAVQADSGWLLHTGDAYYHAGAVHPELGPETRYLKAMTLVNAASPRQALANQGRLRELAATGEATVFCAHDPTELAALQQPSLPA